MHLLFSVDFVIYTKVIIKMSTPYSMDWQDPLTWLVNRSLILLGPPP